MAKIFGNYEIHGDLFLKTYSHEPYPLLLTTDNDGKVTFTYSVNSITASFPIIIDNQTDIVSISHATSSQTSITNNNRDVIQSVTLDSQFGHVLELSSINLDDFYVRYDINTQALDQTERQNARTNIQAVSKDTDDTRTGKLTQNGDVDLTGKLSVINGDILISSNKKIDTIESSGIINIGTDNSQVINIGKSGSTVNIVGDLLYQNVTNLEVTDKLIKLNKGGSVGSAIGTGFEIEENSIITGYLKTNGTRDGWDMKVPSKNADFNLSFDLLSTTNRTQKVQDQDGTIALINTGLLDNRYIRNILVSDLSPLFTSATASTTPTETITFNLSNASPNTFFGNNNSTIGLPSYNTLQALTRINDTNVTLTLGGTPDTALAKPVSLTLGWIGQLEVSRGGTGASSLTGILIGNATYSVTAIQGTSNQLLRRNSTNTAYEFSLLENDNITNSTIQYNKIQNVTADRLLGRLSTNGNIEELTESQIRGFIQKGNLVQGSNISLSGTLSNRLIGSGDITVNHAITSTQSSVSNANGNVIQSITLDTNFGHVTNISTIDLDSRYNNYIHPSGFTNQPSTSLTGSSVISQITVNNEGHVTGVSTRNITLSDLSYSIPSLQSVTDVGNTTTNTITASNFITTSDIKIKTDITPIKNALDTLDKFISYEYFKNGSKEAGFIAQEVKEVIPYTVFENSDGLLTMSDRPILAYLHSAVLELKNEIDKIKDKL